MRQRLVKPHKLELWDVMTRLKFLALAALGLALSSTPSFAQQITEYVTNNSTGSISLQDYSCTSSTCSPIPPSSISAGATSSAFGAIPNANTAYMRVTYGTSTNQCRFISQTNKISGVCSTPITTASRYAGTPTCTVVSSSQDASCNLTVYYRYTK